MISILIAKIILKERNWPSSLSSEDSRGSSSSMQKNVSQIQNIWINRVGDTLTNRSIDE